jgi:hypothetical protein
MATRPVRPSSRITGNDPAEGADPGGTHSTRPGNPDKSGKPRPRHVPDGQRIESGDRNDGTNPGQDPYPYHSVPDKQG